MWVLSIRGASGAEEHYGFMHNVEMWVRVCVWDGAGGQVGFKIGYEIPKNVGMTMARAKGEGWCSSF